MANKTKEQIALDMYDEELEYLSSGEKAAVTKAFNKQPKTRASRRTTVAAANTLSVHIGRVGINGTKNCLVQKGSTVEDLIEQADYTFDTKKESVLEQSTGNKVGLTSKVKNGEIYVITPEIKSAE